MLRRRAGHRDHQSGVVDQPPVVGQQRRPVRRGGPVGAMATAATAPIRRGRGSTEDGVPGQRPQYVAGLGNRPAPTPVGPGSSPGAADQLRHGAHQVRCRPGHQDAALDRTAAGDAHVAGCQAAQAPCTSLNSIYWSRKARSCLSTSTTDRPRLAASSAIPVPVIPPPMTTTSTGRPSARGGQIGTAPGSAQGGGVHQARYPFSAWASSASRSSESRMAATIRPDWITDWVMSSTMAASWRGSASRTVLSS